MGKDVAHTLRTLARGCIVAACSVALPQLAAAQGGLAPDEARKRLESDRSRLEATQRRSKELQKDLDKIAAERQRINARLVETAKLIQQSEAQLNVIEARLGELGAQEKHLLGLLEQSHGKISTVLAAMLRMGRNPPPVMVTSPKDVLSAFRSGMLSTSVFFELKGEAVSLSEKLSDLVRVMTSIREESDKLRRETARLDDARVRLAGAQEEKRQSLAERQAELAQVRKAAAEFTKNVADLGELIAKLDKEVQEKTGLGAYEKEIAAAAPAPSAPSLEQPPPSSTASTGAPAAIVPTEDPSSSVVLAPTGDRVAMLTPGRIKPAIPFAEAKRLAAAAGTGSARPDVRREDPVWQPIQGSRAGNAPRRPGGVPERRVDRLRWRVPQLWPALDHQCRRGLSYSTCWTISDRRATRSIRACRRAGRRDEYGCEDDIG